MTGLSVGASVASLLLAVAAQGTTFPGERTELEGPGGRFAVVWVAADENPSGKHELLIKDLRVGSARLLLRFGRSVSVAWSPNGRLLAVTDHVGSDTAESWVHSLDGSPPFSVWEALERQQGKQRLAFTQRAHHLYVEADRWLSDSTVSVRVWGYGGNGAFDKRMRISLRE